jgi:hypothetical protein
LGQPVNKTSTISHVGWIIKLAQYFEWPFSPWEGKFWDIPECCNEEQQVFPQELDQEHVQQGERVDMINILHMCI